MYLKSIKRPTTSVWRRIKQPESRIHISSMKGPPATADIPQNIAVMILCFNRLLWPTAIISKLRLTTVSRSSHKPSTSVSSLSGSKLRASLFPLREGEVFLLRTRCASGAGERARGGWRFLVRWLNSLARCDGSAGTAVAWPDWRATNKCGRRPCCECERAKYKTKMLKAGPGRAPCGCGTPPHPMSSP